MKYVSVIVDKINWVKENIIGSFYYKKVRENAVIIFASLLIAMFCVLISYPGILYSDSYGRVDTADKVRVAINLLLSGQRALIEPIECWITLVPSVFIAIARMLTGNIATYTLAQSFAFFLVSFLLIKRIGTSYKWLQYILFVINPLFYTEAVYYEASVGCVIGIVAMVLILDSGRNEKNIFDKMIEFGLLALASFVAFGYRANAFTIIPVLAIYIMIQKWHALKKVWVTIALVTGLLLVLFVPKMLKVDTMGSSMAGFVWEMLVSINEMEPEKKEEYIDYLDELAGEGATESALSVVSDYVVLSYMGSDIDAYALSADGATGTVLKKYGEFILREPASYFETKLDFTLKTLGVTEKLRNDEYNYNLIERMWEWGFNDTNERLMFYRQYYAVNNLLGEFILRPWIVYVVSIALVVYEWVKKSKNRELYVFLLLLAIFYYGAYVVNTQSFELRYFYPSLYMMWIMDIAILARIVSDVIKRCMKRK